MHEKRKNPAPHFGAAVGVIIVLAYLYRNYSGSVPHIPDPLWTVAVKIQLILFFSIYIANRVSSALRSRRSGHRHHG